MQSGCLVVTESEESYLLNPTVHMDTAVLASMTLDRSALIYDLKLVLVRGYFHLVDLKHTHECTFTGIME